MAIETLHADLHLGGTFANPDNALGPPDGLWAGTNNTNSTEQSTWRLETPVDALIPGATHVVEALVRKGTNSGNPSITINLFSGGTLVRQIAAGTAITSTVGQTISAEISTAEIVDPADVEIEIVGIFTGGSPSARNSPQVDAITWLADTAVAAPEDHFSGGSPSAVTVSTAGAGSAAEHTGGGSVAEVSVLTSGSGTSAEHATGGTATSIVVTTTGGGFDDQGAPEEHHAGGSATTVVVTSEGAGTALEAVQGGSEARVEVSTAGGGTATETAGGGSDAPVAVSAAGDGTANETATGGSATSVAVTTTGGGFSTVDGDPDEHHAGGSATAIAVVAIGAGTATETTSGGNGTEIAVTAAGDGTAAEHPRGGSGTTVLALTAGAGGALETAGGGAPTLIVVTATGEGRDSTPSPIPPVRISGASLGRRPGASPIAGRPTATLGHRRRRPR